MEIVWRLEKIEEVCPRCEGNGGDPEDGNPVDGPYACRDCHGNGRRCETPNCWTHD